MKSSRRRRRGRMLCRFGKRKIPGMTDAIRHYWTVVRTSLWLVPLLMSALAAGAAFALLEARVQAGSDSPMQRFLYAGDADSARNLLGALLTGMITMFSLVLSITMVVLTLAAAQLGSRLIRNFMDDRSPRPCWGCSWRPCFTC